MFYSNIIKKMYISMTILVLGSICLIRIGTIDFHTIVATGAILIPAIIIMGYLGQRIGDIVDNPKNKADADYRVAVLNALKKMDKSITLQELNEKLTKQVAEPDLPDNKDDVDE
jgi:hypothetical protein